MSKVALFGAAGVIGPSIAAALGRNGRPYRVVGRNEGSLRKAFGADPLAEIVTWNPDSPASVRAAAEDVDTLVYMVGVNYWQFELHPDLMRKTLEGALAAGVKHIILIGTVYPYGRAQSNPVSEDHPREPHTFKGRMRKAQEDLLMQAQADGRIRATVLRLPDFYGPGVEASLLHRAALAAVNGGTADMVGPLDRPHEFVFVPDVGPVVARLVETPAAFGRIWHIAGAGVTTQRELVSEMERQTGAKLKLRVAGKTMLRLIGLFNPFMREMVEMNYLMTEPLLMDDSALQRLIGPIRKTPYAEGVRQMLAAVAKTRTLSAATA
ncbi:NAD-dependent epimerase/dehydratase family protein [Roseateles saccharophilus]|uniref:Nucleoside-diphosphate-sugar epimerase n=1 Tax=Roseateles saccharophilus TaxID=304 RepID=A0A4R3U5P5_ROSSA|nr:NAD-dependent epimerase/dehydratase family protein [Roseateles saccharophilus]MDG0836079.1 NAD-dependent epimerase/dehydratase family protein [Roseateles saccharophilus]TCU82740.1 nucleoside-diphosphate-sugar epimerase [Roseateles saccharophilus]